MAKRFFEQCCRLCLYSGTEVGLVDVFSIPKLNSLILELYNIEVTPNDGCTTRVCSVCLKDTLDFNAQIKQYDRERTQILETNAKILQMLPAALPTTSAVSKVTKDLVTIENRPPSESIQTTKNQIASQNAKNNNEVPRVPQQQAATERPRQIPSKSSDSRISSAEIGITGASNEKASKGSSTKEKDKDKDGSRRSTHNPPDQSTTKPKISVKDVEQRSVSKPGSARSENRPSELGGNSSRGSKESSMPHAKHTDQRQRPSAPKSKRANDSIGSGENRGSTSGESSSKSKDSLKRSTDGRELTKSKNTDSTRSESSGKSGSLKSSDKSPDKKQSSNNRDSSRTKDKHFTNKIARVDQSPRTFLIRENSSVKESGSSKKSASNQCQINITIREPTDKPRATEHSTAPVSNNASVRTHGAASMKQRNTAPEKSDRRESASEPSTSRTKVRFAEGTSGMSSNETQYLEDTAINRKRGPDGPLKLPRIKIRLLNRDAVFEPVVDPVSSSNVTTADLTISTVSATMTNATMCTIATTTTTTNMVTPSSPSSQIVPPGPVVQDRVSELQASKAGIPMRRHSVTNTSLIRVSSNLFDSSKESEEFAAIRNNTMLRLDALKNTVASNVTARPMRQTTTQIPNSAGIDRSSALAPVVLNGAAGSSSSQQQTSVTNTDSVPRAVEKPVMQRRKSVCVANFRLNNEILVQSPNSQHLRILPTTSIPVNNFAGGPYTSSHNGMPVQSTVQNTVPIVRTITYGANPISSGNTTISPLSSDVPSSSAAAPVPALRMTFGNNTIPVHILGRNAPVSTAAGVVGYNVVGVSHTNPVGGSIRMPLAVGENHLNISSLDPRTNIPRNILQPQRPQMSVFEHSYSIN